MNLINSMKVPSSSFLPSITGIYNNSPCCEAAFQALSLLLQHKDLDLECCYHNLQQPENLPKSYENLH